MGDKIFLDTNLWVYFYAKDPPDKYEKVKEIIDKNFDVIILSVQILGELYNVLTKKKFRTEEQAKEIVIETITSFSISEIDTSIVLKALEVKERYGFSYWDSLVISSSLKNGCQILYTEDLQHTQLIEKKLKVLNPFA